jgi:hypothetical protein
MLPFLKLERIGVRVNHFQAKGKRLKGKHKSLVTNH